MPMCCRMHPPPPKQGSPLYMQKPDYGKVPDYLQQNKAKIAKEKARADALLLAAEQVAQQALIAPADAALHGGDNLDK